MNTSIENKLTKLLNIAMLWLLILTLLMLFLPLESLSPELAAKIEGKKFYLYLALIIESSLFISRGLIALTSLIFTKTHVKKTENYMLKTVSTLDFSEKALLREFVLQRRNVLELPLDEPTVNSLLDSGILTLTSNDTENDNKGLFIISKEARPFITYRSIGLSRSKMDDEQISQIMQSRPGFARDTIIVKSYRGQGSLLNAKENQTQAAAKVA